MIVSKFYEFDNSKEDAFLCHHCSFFNKCFDMKYSNMTDLLSYCKNYNSNSHFDVNKIIKGGLSIREDGELLFNNNFKIDELNIKRFYTVHFNKSCVFRGWHGHKFEEKYCLCLSGKVKVEIVKIDNFKFPSKELVPENYILCENDCEILHIPSGYANGVMSIDKNVKSRILFFSNFTILESMSDDHRYNGSLWRMK